MQHQPDPIISTILEYAGPASWASALQVCRKWYEIINGSAVGKPHGCRGIAAEYINANRLKPSVDLLRRPLFGIMQRLNPDYCPSTLAIRNIDLADIAAYPLRSIIGCWIANDGIIPKCCCIIKSTNILREFMWQPKVALIVLDELLGNYPPEPNCRSSTLASLDHLRMHAPPTIGGALFQWEAHIDLAQGKEPMLTAEFRPTVSFAELTLVLLFTDLSIITLDKILDAISKPPMRDSYLREFVVAATCISYKALRFNSGEMKQFRAFAAATKCRHKHTLRVITDYCRC